MTKFGFKHTEETKNRMSIARKQKVGSLSPRWKGGVKKGNGRTYIYCPTHPTTKNVYVLESRLVMEKSVGRYLKSSEIVHHKNEDIEDNKLSNLEITTRATHNVIHKKDKKREKRKRLPNGRFRKGV